MLKILLLSAILLVQSLSWLTGLSTTSVAQTAPDATIHTHESPAVKKAPHTLKSAMPRQRARRAAITAQLAEPVTEDLLPVVDQSNIDMRHRILADEVLRSFPEECVAQLQNFYVRYDNPKNRGLAGKSTIILSGNVPDDEFRALLVHEFGHVTDLGCLRGSDAAEASAFKDGSEEIKSDDESVSFYQISWKNSSKRNTGWSDDDFVSGYAKSDPFEDFAETSAYFFLQRDAFIERAAENPVLAEKLAWMQEHFADTELGEGHHSWNGSVPWDVTKLAFEWNVQP